MIVLDSSVIIEYIDLDGEFHGNAKLIFENLNQGKLHGLIPHPVLAETCYVAERVYAEFDPKNAGKRSKQLVKWLFSHPHLQIVADTINLAILVGELKSKFKLALTDCYVLAVSKIHDAKAIFKKREKEMQNVINIIEKDFKIIFLEDF
nr:PIN domain-containing protein [Candidatus Baldrarchaeota archaeon]